MKEILLLVHVLAGQSNLIRPMPIVYGLHRIADSETMGLSRFGQENKLTLAYVGRIAMIDLGYASFDYLVETVSLEFFVKSGKSIIWFSEINASIVQSVKLNFVVF